MTSKVTSSIILSTLMISLLAVAFNVQPVMAEYSQIYIRADGSIDPPNPNISTVDNTTYALIGDINGSIVVEKDSIVLDGGGHTLYGNGSLQGINLSYRFNVTVRYVSVFGFDVGIWLNSFSRNNTIYGNSIMANVRDGIMLMHACYNNISRNNIEANGWYGIKCMLNSVGNRIYHNRFVGNAQHAGSLDTSQSIWDYGYPSGGNYWGNYTGNDQFRGKYQNLTGADGIGDSPHFITSTEVDSYPLMGPFTPLIGEGANITLFQDPRVGLIFSSVLTAGSANITGLTTGPPLPPNVVLVGLYYNVTVTAEFSGDVIIRIIYDDSGMTPEQEGSLRLLQWEAPAGDVNGDGEVDWRDLLAIIRAWGSYPGHRRWNPSCDINHDNKVDYRDFFLAFSQYGDGPQWRDITEYVDRESNLIIGTAIHFSIFGVTRAD